MHITHHITIMRFCHVYPVCDQPQDPVYRCALMVCCFWEYRRYLQVLQLAQVVL